MNYEALWQLAGWTMIHFLWIGTLGTLVLVALRKLLSRAQPNLRYLTTLVAFAALAVAPIAIALMLSQSMDWTVVESVDRGSMDFNDEAAGGVEILAAKRQAQGQPLVIDLAETPVELDSPVAGAFTPQSTELSPAVLASSLQHAQRDFLRQTLAQVPEYLPWLWIVGTPLTLLLLATGVIGSERLRRQAELLVEGPVYRSVERLRGSLRIGRQVAVAVSDRVLQPVLVGIVRPMILLPSAAVTGWSPEQLEMALVHELAHVRRWDNLVNLLQRAVEAALFFHPCVWLVSRWLRADREHCCDAVVVAHTNQPEAYADLLIRVARDASNHRLPSAAVALSSHPLASRVRRILQLEDDPMVVSKRSVSLVVFAFAAVVTVAMWRGQPASVAEEATSEPGASATGGEGETTEIVENDAPIVLHPGLTREKLDDIEQQLLAAGEKEVSIVVVGDQIQITSDGNTIAAERIVIRGDQMQVMGTTAEFAEAISSLGEPEASATGEEAQTTEEMTRTGVNSGADAPGLPFLPLEQQRMADLAFKMLSMEVAPLDEAQRKALAKQGFAGGVMVDEVPGKGQGFSFGAATTDIQSGDILVGLHVWETPHLETLGGVLRRDDLDQFNPLKYYVLRMVVDEEAIQKIELERQRDMQEEGGEMGFGGAFDAEGGDFGGRGFGGEFGGRGGGRAAARGGRGGFRRPALTQESEIPTKLQLFSGRLSFNQEAWSAEQQRLRASRGAQAAQGPAVGIVALGPAGGTANGPGRKPDKTALRYDGRSFEDWSGSFARELNPEKRAVAVTALRAFGRAGYAKQATEVILKVAEPYRFDTWGDSKGEKLLVTAIVHALGGSDGLAPLPATATVPLIAKRYADDADKYKWLLWHALTGIAPNDSELADLLVELASPDNADADIRSLAFGGLLTLDSQLAEPRTRALWARHLASDNKRVAMAAASSLLVYRPNQSGRGGFPASSDARPTLRELMPEFLPQLFHTDHEVRANARRVLSYASAEQLRADLIALLGNIASEAGHNAEFEGIQLYRTEDDDDAKRIELAAIRALAALGPKGKETLPDLENVIRDGDYPSKVAAYVAALRLLGVETIDNGGMSGVDKVPREFSELAAKTFGLQSDDGGFDAEAVAKLNVAVAREEELTDPNQPQGGLGGGGGMGGGGFF